MSPLLVGYGTLMYRASMGTTLGQESASGKSFLPVIARGFRRLYNLRPTHYSPSRRVSEAPIEVGALNVERADDQWFNALAFAVTAEELVLLDQRERYYERQLVEIEHFTSGASAGRAFVYAAPPDAAWLERAIDKLLPRWEDVVWPRTGAYQISDAFGRAFDATTYLADGRTLMIERYHALLGTEDAASREDLH